MELKNRFTRCSFIKFIFDELKLSPNAELYIFNTDGSMVHGPITETQNLNEGLHMTDLVAGNEVIIQLREPAHSNPQSSLKISSVIHGYKNIFSFISENNERALACHNDVDCYPAWANEADAVAMILFPNGEYTSQCSGSLINNTAQNFRSFLLTAFHCIDIEKDIFGCSDGVLSTSEKANVANWVFRFNFKTPCNGGSFASVTYNKASLLSAWQDSDFALVEINPTLNSFCHYFLGWDRSGYYTPNSTCIHHPDGLPKKISFSYNTPTVHNNIVYWNNCLTSPTNSHLSVYLQSGTAEGGSSGSPLFDNNKRVIGQLHGGEYGCAPVTEYFGRFYSSWTGGGTTSTRLSDWLDPLYSSAMTLNTIKRGVFITSPSNVGYNFDFYATTMNPPPLSNFIWSVTPSSGASIAYYFGANNCYASINFTIEGYYDIAVQVTTACGVESAVKTVYAKPSKGGKSVAFPNPVDDMLNIDLDQMAIVSSKSIMTYDIRLFSAQGNMVSQISAQNGIVQLNTSDLPDGFYYLHIYDGISPTPEVHTIIVKH